MVKAVNEIVVEDWNTNWDKLVKSELSASDSSVAVIEAASQSMMRALKLMFKVEANPSM
jgi:hypothetical protein